MTLVEKILQEAKQVGIIYHYSTIMRILIILEDMKLKDSIYNRGYVSFTRYKNGIKGQGANFARLVIDGDKLSNKYKIVPDSRAKAGEKYGPIKHHLNLQSEERIYKKEVDLTGCIISVDIIKSYAHDEMNKNDAEFIKSKCKLNIIDKKDW